MENLFFLGFTNRGKKDRIELTKEIFSIPCEGRNQRVSEKSRMKIKITKDGPYIVSGSVPLGEMIITPKGNEYEYKEGEKLPQAETYALCRCGKTKTPPFCDGSHAHCDFDGKETASRLPYHERAEHITGMGLDLLDDNRCAFARFCHRAGSNVWDLLWQSKDEEKKAEIIRGANDCPAGRLTAVEKDGTEHEPAYEPSIDILQDPQNRVSCGIFVKGGIPIESVDGETYEIRNRVVLCRCGASENKPFCDAMHVDIRYKDK
jgi:CDGSH-type Zn-finger protein